MLFVSLVSLGSCEQDKIIISKISGVSNHPYSHLETALSVNPIKSNNIVVASMISDGGYSIEYSVIYASFDGCDTWAASLNQTDGSSIFPDGDPALTCDIYGHFYFASLHDGFTVWKSTDGGLKWSKSSVVPGSKAYDREFIVADLQDTFLNRLYTSGKFEIEPQPSNIHPEVMAISQSIDGGASFSSPKTFLPISANEALNAPMSMHLTDKGVLLVSSSKFYLDSIPMDVYANLRMGDGNEIVGKIEMLVSYDKGQQFVPYTVATHQSYGHDMPVKSLKCLGCGGMTSVTSKDDETIYITWIEAVSGYCRVVVSSSKDGKNWSIPVIVDPENHHPSDISNPNIAVNNKGQILVVWNDRRNGSSDMCFQLMGAFSIDGGETFQPSYIIDDQLTCPCRDPEGVIFDDCRFVNGGDTQGIGVLPNDQFVIVYPRDQDGKMELFLARIPDLAYY